MTSRPFRLLATGLLTLAAFAAGRASFGQDEPEPPAEPETVLALKYSLKIHRSPLDSIHGGGVETEELYFPERKVVCNLGADGWSAGGRVNAYYGEIRNFSKEAEMLKRTTGREIPTLPTVEVRVPVELARRIFRLADLTKEREAFATRLAVDVRKAGVLRDPFGR